MPTAAADCIALALVITVVVAVVLQQLLASVSCRKQRHGADQKEVDDYGSHELCTIHTYVITGFLFLVLVGTWLLLSLHLALGWVWVWVWVLAVVNRYLCNSWEPSQIQELARSTAISKQIVRQLQAAETFATLSMNCTQICYYQNWFAASSDVRNVRNSSAYSRWTLVTLFVYIYFMWTNFLHLNIIFLVCSTFKANPNSPSKAAPNVSSRHTKRKTQNAKCKMQFPLETFS